MVLEQGVRSRASGVAGSTSAPSRARARAPRTRTAVLLILAAACGQDDALPQTPREPAPAPAPASPARTVALTFDDLPGVFVDTSLAHARAANERLVATLTRASAHATGFVNEDKLRGSAERTRLLELWLDSGLDLGNHTWGHPDLHRIPLAEYQDATLRGERVTRALMAARGREPRWFRHTFLHTGRDTATRSAFERFLAGHGYRVAPVTIDNYDYLWARAYDRALLASDSVAARRIGDDYVAYMDTVFGFYEAQSRTIFEREPAQVLLLHVNTLNADRMDDLLAMMRARGYAVVPLDSAMRDPIYESADSYTGPAGITWLHRWGMTRGTPPSTFAGEPELPPEIESAQ